MNNQLQNRVHVRMEYASRFTRAIKDFHSIRGFGQCTMHTLVPKAGFDDDGPGSDDGPSVLSVLPEDVLAHVIGVGWSPAHTPILRCRMEQTPKTPSTHPTPSPNHPSSTTGAATATPLPATAEGLAKWTVSVRKRPMYGLDERHLSADFGCVSVIDEHAVVVHDCGLDTSTIHDTAVLTKMNHCLFEFDNVFDDTCSTERVYDAAVAPLLDRYTTKGLPGTILLFGQTGTGKTFTSLGLQQEIARRLYPSASVTLTVIEMTATKCFDLLNDLAQVNLMHGKDGRIHFKNATTMVAESADQLVQHLDQANAQRSSRSLERNFQSSRSHAVYRFGKEGSDDSFTLVDLAGSEGHMDTKRHSSADHRESATINTSLMVLKDCFRSWAQTTEPSAARPSRVDPSASPRPRLRRRVPFRGHPLALLLRPCFESASHAGAIVATVSPLASDLDHTTNTMRSVLNMWHGGASHPKTWSCKVECIRTLEEEEEEQRFVRWGPTRVGQWLGELDGGKFSNVQSAGLDGKRLMALNQNRVRLIILATGVDEVPEEDARRLYEAVREESRRIDTFIFHRRAARSGLARRPSNFMTSNDD